MTGVQFLAGAIMGLFLTATMFRSALQFTWPPVQWMLGVLSPGGKATGA